MLTPSEKLQRLQELKDPSLKMNRILADRSIAEAMMKMETLQGIAGNDGYTPIKGKDYFTEQDINHVVSITQSMVRPAIDGKDGVAGKDGRNGETPIKGIDYWTPKDRESIVADTVSRIPKVKDGISPDKDEIIKSAVEEIRKIPVNFKDIKGTESLIAFLKTGGFRGGGGGGSSSAGVTSFNTRTGAVTLTSGDVTTALGYTPQIPISLTTTGTSGASTFNAGTGVLNIPQYTSGGTPGGLNLQVQYNNAGAFGGISGAVTNGTILNLTNPLLGGATLTTSTVNGVTLVNGGTSTLYLSQDGTYTTPAGTYVLPTASTSILGGVKVDGTSITISGGVISATSSGGGTVTSVSGTTNRITVATGTTTPVIDISGSYVGQSSITTLGTITTGVWNGTAIANANLANSSLTIGSTNISLGVTSTTLAGLTSVTSTTFVGALTGNASTATALATARTIGTLTGDATTAGSSFDGTSNNTNALTLATVNSNVGSFAIATVTVNGKGLVTAASAAATTGSGSVVLATSPTLTTASLGSSTATTQAPSDNSTKVATTAYVAAALLGQDFKEACKYGTTTALPAIVYNNGTSGVGATLTAVSFGAITLDGSTPSVGDRILIKNQVSTFQNGIYVVTVVGAVATLFVLTRSTDFNQSFEIDTGDSVFITSGSTLSTTTWAYNGIDQPTMGTDAITFAQTAGQGSFTAGNGITITGTSIAIDTSVTVDKTTPQTLSSKTFVAPVLGTPASGTVTNLTGTASININGTVGATTPSTGVFTTGIINTNLQINFTGRSETLAVKGSASVATALFATTGLSAGTSNGVEIVAGTNSSDYALNVFSQASSQLFLVRGDGNVGIGTTLPRANLDVTNGTANVDGNTSNALNLTAANVALNSSNTNLSVNTNDAQAADVGGSIGLGALYRGSDRGSLNYAIIKSGKTNSTDSNYSGYLSFGTRNNGSQVAEAMRIDNLGNVGIGTTAPDVRFQVGDYAEQNTLKVTGLSTANMAPVISLYRSGAREYVIAGVGNNMYFANTGGLANYNDTTIAAAANMTIGNSGNVGIGTTSPTAVLQLNAGTATASTAPLKFTSGTNLTTTEAGAIEYDGSHLYFTATNGGTRFQLDQQTSNNVSNTVTQTAHGFTVGQVLKFTSGAYALAKADTAADAEGLGVVSTVIGVNSFIITTNGFITGLTGLTANTEYFLDPVTAGALTATAPTTAGQITKPMFFATTTTTGYVINYRGSVVGPSPTVITGTRFVAPNGYISPDATTSNDNFSANNIAVVQFYLPYTIVVNSLKAQVTTADAAASTIQLGLYTSAGVLLAGTTTLSSTTTGLKSGSVTSVTVSPGFYWAAYVTNSATVRCQGYFNSGVMYDNTVVGTAANTVSGGVMPSTLGAISGSSSSNNPPLVLISN